MPTRSIRRAPEGDGRAPIRSAYSVMQSSLESRVVSLRASRLQPLGGQAEGLRGAVSCRLVAPDPRLPPPRGRPPLTREKKRARVVGTECRSTPGPDALDPSRPRHSPARTPHAPVTCPAAARPPARQAPENEGRQPRVDAELSVCNAPMPAMRGDSRLLKTGRSFRFLFYSATSQTKQVARAGCTSLSLRTECDALLMVACRECGAANFPLRNEFPS